MRSPAPFLCLLVGLSLCASLRAQSCGSVFVSIAPNGPGCSPSGGVVPALVAQFWAWGPPPCFITFTVAPPPTGASALLIVGASDPALGLAPVGLPGCVLRASPDVLLPMPWGSPYCGPSAPSCTGWFIRSVAIPSDPVLIGSTAYFQALLFATAWPAPAGPMLSNGVSVSLF